MFACTQKVSARRDTVSESHCVFVAVTILFPSQRGRPLQWLVQNTCFQCVRLYGYQLPFKCLFLL